MNERAREKNAGRYVLNTLRNLSPIVSGADPARLLGRFADVPAVIVGAGPSLDRNIADLAAWGGRALIISTDTAWRPLATAGIDPHIVVAVDPTDINGRHLTDVPSRRQPWLLAEGSVDPEALRQLKGRVGTFRVGPHHPWPWLQSLGVERPVVRVSGSVITAAYDLALGFGCGPIIFTGADLAFTNVQPYCRGTTFERDWAVHTARGVSLATVWKNTLMARTLIVEAGVHGDRALTSPHLVEFRNWLVARAGEAPGCRTVNASGSGILVGGTIEQADLGAVLDAYPERGEALRDSIDDLLRMPPCDQAAMRVCAAFSTLERTTYASDAAALPPTVSDWRTFGAPTLLVGQIMAAAASGCRSFFATTTGTLAASVTGLDARAAFAAGGVDVIRPDVLSERGLPRAWRCATAGDGHAVVTPITGVDSVRVSSDGTWEIGESWPCDISGEVAWGLAGGAIAWNRSTRTLLRRPAAGAVPVVEAVSFEPVCVALLPGGAAVWYAADGTLWDWLPGAPGRFLAQAPVCGGLFVDGAELALAPIIRDEQGHLTRQRLYYEWRYDVRSSSLRRVDAGLDGQCLALAVHQDWTARAFSFSDVVRLDERDGRSVLLACPGPFGVAWAGPSLLVTTLDSQVLLFRDLARRLSTWPIDSRIAAGDTAPLKDRCSLC